MIHLVRVSSPRDSINQINKCLLEFIPWTKLWEISVSQKFPLLSEATPKLRYFRVTFPLCDRLHTRTQTQILIYIYSYPWRMMASSFIQIPYERVM